MQCDKIPGELAHNPPGATERQRLFTFTPYVREAQEVMRPTWHLKPRRLFDFMLLHWIDGTGELTIADHTYSAENGDIFWVPPDTLHEMRGDAPGTLMRYIHFDLYYDPRRSHWSARIPGDTRDIARWQDRMHPPINDPVIGHWCGKLPAGNPSPVNELLRRIIMEYNRTQTSNLLISGLVCQLIGHLLDTQPASPVESRHIRTLESAMQHIQTHCHEKLDIDALARKHGLSTTHFRKLFREHYRQNPRTAHLNAKMRVACDSLIYSGLSISEIADRLGFTNIHNFSRAFRNTIGRTPTAYRNGDT